MEGKRSIFAKRLELIVLVGILIAALPVLQGCGAAEADMDPVIVEEDGTDPGRFETQKENAGEGYDVEGAAEFAENTSETEMEKEEQEKEQFPKELSLYYDDHLDIRDKKIEIVDAGEPKSFQVGFGVEEGTPDVAVISIDNNTLIASGIGSAKIKVDGSDCAITVTPAPISLFLLLGQSNMEGMEGEPAQSISCPDGQVYSSYGENSKLNRYTATYYAPSALTGALRDVNVVGTTEYLSDFPVYSLTESGNGKSGMDSGIAYEWVKRTGEKVWLVNAAHNGAVIQTYQPFNENYIEAVTLFSSCQDTLKQEIQAGHYILSHMGCFWCQGCSDQTSPADAYAIKFQTMYNSLKTDLSADLDNNPDTPDNSLEFANIILVMAGGGTSRERGYRGGLYPDEDTGFYGTYKEMEMRGPRVAQLWMGANPDLPDINVVCNLGDRWMKMPDGTDGVEEYFSDKYENGRVDYNTQEPQAEEWYSPKTTLEVKDTAHYNQVGYNEVGIEAAHNTCILLGYLEDTDEPTTVQFVDWTGYEEAATIEPFTWGQVGTLVVPVVSPIYRAKQVSYTVSDGLRYEYYDLLTDNYNIKEGVLSAVGAEGPVVKVAEKSNG